MKLTPLQKRAERKNRNQTMVDMNLVSLIDVFTILIFFLLSSASGVELLASPKAVKLPESVAEKAPKESIVVVVSADDILVDGRKVASVAEVMATPGDLIAPLKAELDALASRPMVGGGVAGGVGAGVGGGQAAPAQALTIMGDQTIPYQLLRKVMVTSARANFSDLSFAVRRKDV